MPVIVLLNPDFLSGALGAGASGSAVGWARHGSALPELVPERRTVRPAAGHSRRGGGRVSDRAAILRLGRHNRMAPPPRTIATPIAAARYTLIISGTRFAI